MGTLPSGSPGRSGVVSSTAYFASSSFVAFLARGIFRPLASRWTKNWWAEE